MSDLQSFASDLNSLVPDQPADRRNFIFGGLASGFALCVAPVGDLLAQTIQTPTTGLDAGEVQVAVQGHQIPAYRAVREGLKGAPVIVVVHEAFGVHEHIRDICRRFANEGWFAIAPELFARYGDASKYSTVAEVFQHVISKVPDAEVLSDIDACVQWSGEQGADANRLGITGFCWGGRIVWMYAAHQKQLKAGVAWYGRLVGSVDAKTPTHPHDIAEKITAPVLGLYGGQDSGIPLTTVDEMRTRLSFGGEGAQASEFKVYADAPHAFNADYRPSYRPEVAKDAWARCLAWLRQHKAG